MPKKFKIKKGLEILGFKKDISIDTKSFILDEITKYIFNTSKCIKSKEKIFDLELDFKYYYCDFYKLGIDLNKDDISWWEFDALLEGIFLSKDSVIGQVIQYRTYKKPPKNVKTSEAQEHKFYMEKKKHYSLPDKSSVEENLKKLWDYVKKKAGGLNE